MVQHEDWRGVQAGENGEPIVQVTRGANMPVRRVAGLAMRFDPHGEKRVQQLR